MKPKPPYTKHMELTSSGNKCCLILLFILISTLFFFNSAAANTTVSANHTKQVIKEFHIPLTDHNTALAAYEPYQNEIFMMHYISKT